MTTLRGIIFYMIMYGLMAPLFLLAFPFALLPSPKPAKDFQTWWCKILLKVLALTTGLRFRVEGQEHIQDKPVIYASKHQSAFETAALRVVLKDPSFALKQELLWIPILNVFLKRSRMIFLDRSAGRDSLRKLVQGAKDAMDDGNPVVIFPEGTRTKPGAKTTYFPGVYFIYHNLQKSVVPIALNSGAFWPRKGLGKRPGCIIIRFLPPIEPGLDRKIFMERLETQIESVSNELLKEVTHA